MDLVFCLAGIGFFLLFGTSLCLILIVLLFATDSVVKFLEKVERNLYTVETLISTAALINFSRNFGHDLLSKMRLLNELRLLIEDGTY